MPTNPNLLLTKDRLTIAAKRFPKRHLAIFINNLIAHQEDIE